MSRVFAEYGEMLKSSDQTWVIWYPHAPYSPIVHFHRNKKNLHGKRRCDRSRTAHVYMQGGNETTDLDIAMLRGPAWLVDAVFW